LHGILQAAGWAKPRAATGWEEKVQVKAKPGFRTGWEISLEEFCRK